MLIITFISHILSENPFPGKYILKLRDDKNFTFYINDSDFRLLNTKKTDKNQIEKARMEIKFELYKKGYKIMNEFGHICKNVNGPGVINCREKENEYSAWNIHTREEGIIFETNGYCLMNHTPYKEREKKGIYSNYVHANKCDPLNTTNTQHIFILERKDENKKIDKNTRLLKEERDQRRNSDSSSSSSDDNSFSDIMRDILCRKRGRGMPPLIRNAIHSQGFGRINALKC